MHFSTRRTVRFADCDPAGIVFFPQYMVMLNTLVEEWFDDGLRIPYAGLIGTRRTGLPTVRLEVDFTAISRHGDLLTQRVELEKLGRSSLTLKHEFLGAPARGRGDGDGGVDGDGHGLELRLRARQVLVCTSLLTHKPQALPDDLRAALLPYLNHPPGESST